VRREKEKPPSRKERGGAKKTLFSKKERRCREVGRRETSAELVGMRESSLFSSGEEGVKASARGKKGRYLLFSG